MGCLHRPQLQTLQNATWPGLVGLENGGEPAVPLIRGTPLLYVARVMGNHTCVAVLCQGGFHSWIGFVTRDALLSLTSSF